MKKILLCILILYMFLFVSQPINAMETTNSNSNDRRLSSGTGAYGYSPSNYNPKNGIPRLTPPIVVDKNENYVQLLIKALNTDLPVADRVKACEDIRNLPNTTNLTKSQLYALKIAIRYKKYNLWYRTKMYAPDGSLRYRAKQEVLEGFEFYLSKCRDAATEIEMHKTLFFLGLCEYATDNKTIGSQTTSEELNALKDKLWRRDYMLLSSIKDITIAICDEDKTIEDIVGMIKAINY